MDSSEDIGETVFEDLETERGLACRWPISIQSVAHFYRRGVLDRRRVFGLCKDQ